MGKQRGYTGKRYGLLTVLSEDKHPYYEMLCDCGRKKRVSVWDAGRTEGTRSCGCLNGLAHTKNLLGKTFGRLTVLEKLKKRSNRGDVHWRCQCKCGNFHTASSSDLRRKCVRSCGCLMRDVLQNQVYENLTGKKIGCWEVIRKSSFKNPWTWSSYWVCKSLFDSCVIRILSTTDIKRSKSEEWYKERILKYILRDESPQNYLYVLNRGDVLKIGYTKITYFGARLKSIEESFGKFQLSLLVQGNKSTILTTERYLHKKFQKYQKIQKSSFQNGNTEWFDSRCFNDVKKEIQNLFGDSYESFNRC